MGTLLGLGLRVAVAAWRHRWPAMAVAWLVCGVGWGWVAAIPDQYEASARLYVDADAVLTPLLKGIAIDSALGSQLDVLQRTLLSRPNLAHLVSATDLDLAVTGPADLEALEVRLASDIRIVPTTRNLFTISYRNHSPKLAFDVVQAILTTFIESKTGNNRSEMENAQAFLAQHERDWLDEIARSAPGLQAEYVNLNRDYDVLRRNYEELLGRRESMRIATAAEADADKIKIQIIDPPVVPHNVVAPRRGLLLSGVLGAGLAAGVGLAVMLVQFDDSFHTIDELRGFGLVVIGGVSMLRDGARGGQARPMLLYGASLAMLLAVYGGLVWRMLRGPGGAA